MYKHCKEHLQLADMPIRVLTACVACSAAGAEEAMALTPILDSVMESPEGWESLVLATAKRQQPGAVASLLKLGLLHCRWGAEQAAPWLNLQLCVCGCASWADCAAMWRRIVSCSDSNRPGCTALGCCCARGRHQRMVPP
jgi:hypothetical protein